MGVITAEQYRESLKDGRVVYCGGERVEDVAQHPSLRVNFLMCAMDYVLAQDPRYQGLFTERNEDGELVHFVFIPPKSPQDLLRRRQIIQIAARTCLGLPAAAKFTGVDGLNALAVVCRRLDGYTGMNYTERVEAYRQYVQKHDPAMGLAMTDVKGDRSLRPSKQQTHKDYYLRIVDERSDGIVVRGAKMHISNAPCVNELIVLPTRNMRADEKEYAVAFALPVNTKGVTLISSPHEGVEEGNFFDFPLRARQYTADAMVIFDDVFIPMERVFMKGEWQFAGDMAYVFADFHRVSADAYKYANLEIMAGAAMLLAEYNGLGNIPHVRDKLSWLILYAEATDALGRIACENCVPEHDSNLVYPNPMCSNIAKFFFADNYHQAVKHIQDIAGGAMVTMPSSKDFLNPETRPWMEKYCGGKAGIPAEHRIRALKLAKDLSSVDEAVLSMHAEGSLAAQRLSIFSVADFERFKAAAKRACGIEDGEEHSLFAQLPQFPRAV